MSTIEKFLDWWLQKTVIVNCDKDPYLHRWYLIRWNILGIFIHKFVRSDEDRALHDHPWDFIVIPIWRGYVEHSEHEYSKETPLGHLGIRAMATQRRVYPIIGTRFRRGTYRHRVELLTQEWICQDCEGTGKWHNDLGPFDCPGCGGNQYKYGQELPAWSIFIRFKKFRDWGFWPRGVFVKWNEWWKQNCGGD